jgi:hypothetical protein
MWLFKSTSLWSFLPDMHALYDSVGMVSAIQPYERQFGPKNGQSLPEKNMSKGVDSNLVENVATF